MFKAKAIVGFLSLLIPNFAFCGRATATTASFTSDLGTGFQDSYHGSSELVIITVFCVAALILGVALIVGLLMSLQDEKNRII